MNLLGIDIGTTHCKAALFDERGILLNIATIATPRFQDPAHGYFFDPEAIWQATAQVVADAIAEAPLNEIAGVAVASMAETGLLIDRQSGTPRTAMLPWFNTSAQAQAEILEAVAGGMAGFQTSGIRPSFKCSLAKLMWLKQVDPAQLTNSVWLSAADYIVYRLTGQFITDDSLAGRTFAYDIQDRRWKTPLLHELGLSPDLFPRVRPSGTMLPALGDGLLAAGTPVCVAGHDHICAVTTLGDSASASVLDSMGTAESLVGSYAAVLLGQAEYDSGLSFGCHVLPDQLYWLGGLSSSGGSIEWLRAQFNDQGLSYDEVQALLAQVSGPTGILFFPFLAGGSILPANSSARASLLGLTAKHGRAHILKAILEGTAFEMARIRQLAEALLNRPIKQVIAVGGGTQNASWLQVKADVYGHDVVVPAQQEATLLGAALIAGIGCGLYADATAALQAVSQPPARIFQPDLDNHSRYQQLYETGYLKLLPLLQDYYSGA